MERFQDELQRKLLAKDIISVFKQLKSSNQNVVMLDFNLVPSSTTSISIGFTKGGQSFYSFEAQIHLLNETVRTV